MILTNENYHSTEANREYLSVSQYKKFFGSLGQIGCEASAMAELNGEWEEKKSTALYVGSYVDAHFEGTLDLFKAKNPQIFTLKGELRSEYKRAEEVINRIERDKYFMERLSGQKQVIMTGEIFGARWKIKIDSYFPTKMIVDLKVMKSIRESTYVKDFGYMEFIRYWGYDIQAAVYQEIVRQNTGDRLPFEIVGSSKEEYPDIEAIRLEQSLMDAAMREIEKNTPMIIALKSGDAYPIRCEKCNYCKHTRVLTGAIWSSELLGAV